MKHFTVIQMQYIDTVNKNLTVSKSLKLVHVLVPEPAFMQIEIIDAINQFNFKSMLFQCYILEWETQTPQN